MTHNEELSNNLLEVVLRSVTEHAVEEELLEKPLVVAVSGGPDSLALLYALCELRGDGASTSLHVAHLDHGLRGSEAEEDARFVQATAGALGIPCSVGRVDVRSYAAREGLSVEEAARRARYSFLSDVSSRTGGLVTVAHTADDQAETVLMNILRGAGTSGLRGMSVLGEVPVYSGNSTEWTHSSTVTVFRPLLGASRSEVLDYCQGRGLHPRSDSTNLDPGYTRNRLRLELIPLLERDYSPGIRRHLSTLAEIASEEDAVLEALAGQAWEQIAASDAAQASVCFNSSLAKTFARGLLRRLVRRAFLTLAGTLTDVSFAHVEAVVELMLSDRSSAPAVHLPHGLEVFRSGSATLLARRQAAGVLLPSWATRWPLFAAGAEQAISDGGEIDLGAGWVLRCRTIPLSQSTAVPGELVALFDAGRLEEMGSPALRTRRTGDFLRPLGMEGSKSLQDLMVDAKIPRDMRNRLAIIALEGRSNEVLWVPGPGGRRSRQAPVGSDTRRLLVLEFMREGGS